jgi:4'-phosphopantetheinyl transferase
VPDDTASADVTTRAIDELEREVHVYLVRPEEIAAARLASYPSLLSEAERARHQRFHFEVHRKLYLVSHVLVRTTLSRYVEHDPASWRFEEGEFGRPEIASEQNAAGLRFNLSHTENLAACVVARQRDCGVDVERLHRVRDLDGVARRVFTGPELEDLKGREGDDLQGRFTDYWTLKEAYMKARGKGFQLPPETFTMQIDTASNESARLEVGDDFDDHGSDWQFDLRRLEYDDPPAYRLGVALRTSEQGARPLVIRTPELP